MEEQDAAHHSNGIDSTLPAQQTFGKKRRQSGQHQGTTFSRFRLRHEASQNSLSESPTPTFNTVILTRTQLTSPRSLFEVEKEKEEGTGLNRMPSLFQRTASVIASNFSSLESLEGQSYHPHPLPPPCPHTQLGEFRDAKRYPECVAKSDTVLCIEVPVTEGGHRILLQTVRRAARGRGAMGDTM